MRRNSAMPPSRTAPLLYILCVATSLVLLSGLDAREHRLRSRRLGDDGAARADGDLATARNDTFAHDWAPTLNTPGDHSWVLSRVVGILSMQGGFALLEAGSVRPANKANIMMKNVADLSISLVGYAACGYSLSFSAGSSFIGGWGRAFLLGADDEYTTVLHQFSFAATTGTIVSGAVAERLRFKSYLWMTLILTNVLYAACCHWAWHPEGFLYKLRFVDFAGAGVVHLLGGTSALVATCAIGPRTGRFGALPPLLVAVQNAKFRVRQRLARLGCGPASRPASRERESGRERESARHARIAKIRAASEFRISDPVNVIYGTFVLWVGWLSFNCSGTLGLTSGRESLTARVGLVTCLGGAFGAIAGLLYSQVRTGGAFFEVEPVSVGALAGMRSKHTLRLGPCLAFTFPPLTMYPPCNHETVPRHGRPRLDHRGVCEHRAVGRRARRLHRRAPRVRRARRPRVPPHRRPGIA